MESYLIQLTEEQFDKQYPQIDNIIDKNYSSFNNKMYETYGEELDFVIKMAKENRVITIVESESESEFMNLCYLSGFHTVNRLGYLISENKINVNFEVKLD
jgi:hypothetical protein